VPEAYLEFYRIESKSGVCMMYRATTKLPDEVLLRRLLALSFLALIALSISTIVALKAFAPPRISSDYSSALKRRAWLASREGYLVDAQLKHTKDFYRDGPAVQQIIRNHSSVEESEELAKAIVFESKRANLDPVLVTAIIKAESTFNRLARSNAGAIGLMQIQPATGKYVSNRVKELSWEEAKLTDPQYNIRLGIAYFKYLENLFGSKERALIAYNWGPTKLARALKSGEEIPSGPQSYAKKILSLHAKWQGRATSTQVASLDIG
jgi:soluble lytic murein transglycosylase-like protein